MRTRLMSFTRSWVIVSLLAALAFSAIGVAPAYAWSGTGHFVLESIGYFDGTHARAYTVAPNFRQASTSLGQANSLISSVDAADVYVNFDTDTSGKNIRVVYTTDGTAPTKTNGSVVDAAFSKYAAPNSTWYATLPTQTAGTPVNYVFYISDSDLASSWGRISGTSANRNVSQYQTTWTESDGAYFSYNVAYTVSYNANGATGGTAPSDQTKTQDVGLTLATNSGNLVKTGYTFTGWNTQADGLGTHYAAGGTYTANASVTLYADWSPLPNLTWNTFLGGTGQEGSGNRVVVDGNGYIYMVGFSTATWQDAAAPLRAYTAGTDLMLAKLDPQGNLLWHTFLGGTGNEWGSGPVIDGSGNLYVVGYSNAAWSCAPVACTVRAFTVNGANNDGFVAKLDANGNLLWNTFLGGTGIDSGGSLALDGSGNIYLVGNSNISWGSPVRAHDPGVNDDAQVVKLDSSGNLVWNTFLGGTGTNNGNALVVDGSGNVFVSGTSAAAWSCSPACSTVRAFTVSGTNGDGYAAKLNSDGVMQWNTFLGGTGSEVSFGLAMDTGGNLYVGGWGSASWGSPVRAFTTGSNDVYVAQLNSSGALQWNTFLGGTGNDTGATILWDGNGNLYIPGSSSAAWSCAPVACTARAFTTNGTNLDGFNAKLTAANGNLLWNTFLGGTGNDGAMTLTTDGSGNLYTAGYSAAAWQGASTPVRAYTAGEDAFVAKLSLYFKVTYNGNGNDGGSLPTDNEVYSVGETVNALFSPLPTKTGYTFAGWSDGVTTYTSGGTQSFAMGTSDVTLAAQWTLNTYTVTYASNGSDGGSVPTDGNTYHLGNTVTVLFTPLPSRTGYTFAGWSDGSTTYTSGGTTSFTMGSNNVTLTAQWTINTYTVSFDGNGNTSGTAPDNQTKTYGVDLTLATNSGSLIKTGYTFTGWNTQADGLGTHYEAGGAYTANAAITLYAQWNAVVVPGANGGNGPGGVGVTDGSSNLTVWLRADKGVYSDAGCTTAATSSVGCWKDQSGHNRLYTQSTSGSQPGYYTGAQNGLPVLRFDGTADYLANPGSAGAVLAAGDDTFTYFASWKAAALQSTVIFEQNNSTPVNGQRAALMARNPSTGRYGFNGEVNDFDITAASYTANTYNVSAIVMGTGSANILVTGNGASFTPGTPFDLSTENVSTSGGTAVGYKITRNNEFFNGDIPEIIAYTDALPAVERILVENYLSAKYNVALSANDVYTGDEVGNGNFDQDVAGIGRTGGSNHTQSHSAGLIVVNRTFLQDNGDWLTFGHLTVTNSKTTADLPTSGDWATALSPMRWARHWYFSRTDAAGTTGGTVDLIFDFSEGGMGGQSPVGPASNYRLLKRSGTTGAFSDIATATAIVGDQVQFLGVDVNLLGSNFTLGTLNDTSSPTAISLNTLAAAPTDRASEPFGQLGLALILAVSGAVLVIKRKRTTSA